MSKQIEAFTFQVLYYHNQESNHLLFVAEVLTTTFGAVLEKSHWLRILKQSSPKHLATLWWQTEALRGTAGCLCYGTCIQPPSPHLSESTSLAQDPLFYSSSLEATAWSGAKSVNYCSMGKLPEPRWARGRTSAVCFSFPLVCSHLFFGSSLDSASDR